MTLDTLIHSKNKIWLEITSLGLLTIIGIAIFGIIPSLLIIEDIFIQGIGISLLIGLSFVVFKIIKLLEKGIIVFTITEKLFK